MTNREQPDHAGSNDLTNTSHGRGRIKPGEVRNRWGRGGKPKPGVANELDETLSELIYQPIVNSQTGEKIEPVAFYLHNLIRGVSKGNIRALELYHEALSKFAPKLALEEEPLAADERRRALIAKAVERYSAKSKAANADRQSGAEVDDLAEGRSSDDRPEDGQADVAP